MLDIRPIDSRFAVAPQIAPEDAAEIRAAGYVLVINNRPDDEAPGQPTGEAVEAVEAGEAGEGRRAKKQSKVVRERVGAFTILRSGGRKWRR